MATLALILTFSPGEKEQRISAFGFADDCPANPVAQITQQRRMILPLPGERAGERASVELTCRVRWTQLLLGIVNKSRFDETEATILNGEDLDVPTFIRRGVALN